MRQALRDAEHLFRMAGLFAGGVVVFLIVRAFLVPDDFGRFGHFRAGALDDNRAKAVVFAGREACGECHGDVVEAKAGGGHEQVGCEACHGAHAAHAGDPASIVPERPESKTLCPVCHAASTSKPPAFPQVDVEDHAGEMACGDCHPAHAPGL